MTKFEITGLGIDKRTEYPLVILHNKDKDLILPIWIGPLEAQSIAIGLQKEDLDRPLTHSLLINTIQSLGGAIDRIEVHTVKNKTFFADLIIRNEKGEEIFIDSRPSDCISIAVRLSIPIYISDQVIEDATIPAIIHYENNETDEFSLDKKEEFMDFLDSVKASDFKLPDDEDLEK